MRILIVEDEVRLASTLQDLLELNGYSADLCHDGESGLDNAVTAIYDVIILDVMLPKMDGFSVLRQLREAGNNTPVLMLTARSEVSDRVEGLDCGADYYLTKPFAPKELLACIRALTRRQPDLHASDLVEYGDLTLDKSTFTLTCGQRSAHLSRKEFDMMERLMRNRDVVIAKEALLLKVWGYESNAEDNHVEVYISFLRKKLTYLHSRVRIKTIRMVGYCLDFTAP